MRWFTIPVRTCLFKEGDDVVELARRYTEGIAGPQDIIALAESAVAITQRRAVLPESVRPGFWARLISRFPAKHGSLATPPAMQLAIQEAGLPRILLGCLAAAAGKLIGRKGYFYLVAGRELALIDDIAGTMWPYERHIVLGPKEPGKIVTAIKKVCGAEAVIADVNDIKCVDILAATSKEAARAASEALVDNPFGNDDQQTPIVVIKRRGERAGGGFCRVTNAWSRIFTSGGRQVSAVAVEAVPSLRYRVVKPGPPVFTVLFENARANLPGEPVPVHDGLVEEITVRSAGSSSLALEVSLNAAAPFAISAEEGIPARLTVSFDRAPFNAPLMGKKIVLDPGHGGNDPGGRGPVDLLEKNVVLTMAEEMKKWLTQAGAQVFLTRAEDRAVSREERFRLGKEVRADVFLSLHTNCSKNEHEGGLAVHFNPAGPGESASLALSVAEELARKTKRNIREVKEDPDLAALGGTAGLKVMPVTITNWVEEGLLRNPTFYEKIALAVLIGLNRHFRAGSP